MPGAECCLKLRISTEPDGYNKGFIIKRSAGVNRINNIHMSPDASNIGPGTRLYCPDPFNQTPDCARKTYTWIFGIITSNPNQVGIHLGSSDFYQFDQLFFGYTNTAIRLGASKDYPIYDPIDGTTWTNEQIPGSSPDKPGISTGPWGQISNIGVEGNIALHFVWPTQLSTMITNLHVANGFEDGRNFPAVTGTGDLQNLPVRGVFVFEPTYSKANNDPDGLIPPVVQVTNVHIGGGGGQLPVLGPGSSQARAGRIFLVGGDVTMEIFGFKTKPAFSDESLMIAASSTAGEVNIRLRGYIRNGKPQGDKQVEKDGIISPLR